MLEKAAEERPGADVYCCSAQAALPTEAIRSAIYVAMVTPDVAAYEFHETCHSVQTKDHITASVKYQFLLVSENDFLHRLW